MSKSPNTVVVGAFVLGAFLVLFGLLFTLSGNLFERNVDKGLMVFDGSVKGLNIGAPVAFKGVQIGEVVDFDVIVDVDTYEVLTPVEVRIYTDRIVGIRGGKVVEHDDFDATDALIERGLRAQLQLQSLLTGLLYIQLDFHPGRPPRYTEADLEKYDLPEDLGIVPTIPTDMERLARSLEEFDFRALFNNIETALAGIDRFINDEDFQALPENIGATLAAVEQLSSRLDGEIEAMSPDMQALVANAGGTMKTLNEDMPALSAEAQKSLTELTAALSAAETTLSNVDYLLSDDSAVLYEIRTAAKELGAAGRALQSLAETIETQPESIFKGKSPLAN